MATTTKALLHRLAEGIEELTSSERWREWLEVQSRFHDYSFGNAVLILRQFPRATRVAGFRTWKKLGRSVRKGEKAIWILAPVRYKKEETAPGEEATLVVRGFKAVPVFDVSQTEGSELPDVAVRLKGADSGDAYEDLQTVARGLGFTVVEECLGGAINGDCSHSEWRIRIETGNDRRQQVKTLAHEIGHAILHAPGGSRPEDRVVRELEAESVAYVVCQQLGVETGGYSFGYVAVWAGGGERAQEALRASGSRIQRAADAVLTTIAALRIDGAEEVVPPDEPDPSPSEPPSPSPLDRRLS